MTSLLSLARGVRDKSETKAESSAVTPPPPPPSPNHASTESPSLPVWDKAWFSEASDRLAPILSRVFHHGVAHQHHRVREAVVTLSATVTTDCATTLSLSFLPALEALVTLRDDGFVTVARPAAQAVSSVLATLATSPRQLFRVTKALKPLFWRGLAALPRACLLYTSDAADE